MKINIVKTGSYLLLGILFLGCSDDENQKVINHYTNLVLADEFDTNGAPNSLLWTNDIGTGINGWGNNELQYYTARSQNIKVQDGKLIITALNENYLGSSYTSAKIISKGKFSQKYGRFEARIKMPWGKGLWPAFWLLGDNIDQVSWPQCGEIDIMEYRGQNPTEILGSVHGPGYSGASSIGKSFVLTNDRFDTGFHTFGIEWGPNFINYYVDDKLYNQITPDDVTGEWVFNSSSFYIIMNLAVGGNFLGSPNSETQFPQTMEIDYIRVYN